ncbi:uncharacterized protein LOC128885872 [Hylaeus anthracinus]|uniref:uncharacterized protein LOC128874415 n=1 Tax=Hylaeus volcanicus TaxID=313075 RepID=UPI0023B841C9|nr:uncharacterized protein LOC128874415 [Hylaeus volcanicus]XP_053996168.1 uncharacterized protein LOC128885872 [Hylaeus anthracinus]
MVLVEFLVFDVTTKQYYRYAYLEGYYLIALSYLVIVLYGYTWFDSTPILETLIVGASIVMMIFTIISYVRYDESMYIVHRYEHYKYVVFIVMTLVALVLLIIDFILLIMQALGKSPGFMKSSGRSRQTVGD